MKEEQKLIKILQKYKFDMPVPEDVRSDSFRARKDILVNIFKTKKKYSFFVFLVLKLYFLLKHLGISFSVAASSIIVGTLLVITTSATAIGSYIAVKHIVDTGKPGAEIQQENDELDNSSKSAGTKLPENEKTVVQSEKPPVTETPKKDVTLEPAFYSIGITNFDYEEDTGPLAKKVTRTMHRELVRLKGNSTVTYVSSKNKNKIRNYLVGSVIKYGEIYRVTARLVSKKTSQVILYQTESANSEAELDAACKRLSLKVANKIK